MLDAVDVEPSGLVQRDIVGSEDRAGRTTDLLSRIAGRELSVDRRVYEAELESDDRNTAIAHLLKSVGHLGAEPADLRFAGAEAVTARSVDGFGENTSTTVDFSEVRAIDGAARRLLRDAFRALEDDDHRVVARDPDGFMGPPDRSESAGENEVPVGQR